MSSIKALLKETMDDIWFHISTFCDVKERGRLYVSHKHIYVNWKSLILHHVGHQTSLKTFQAIITGEWESLLNVSRLNNYLSLNSGKQILVWSPWCSSELMETKSRCIRVHLKKSHGHGRFIYWIRRLICTKYKCALLHTDYIVAQCRWSRGYSIPVALSREICMRPFILSGNTFRVKLLVQDISHRLVNNGYPRLFIKCFEFKK